MPSTLVKLEQTESMPGVVLLRRVSDDSILDQYPLRAVRDLLGTNKRAFWLASHDGSSWHFHVEVAAELIG